MGCSRPLSPLGNVRLDEREGEAALPLRCRCASVALGTSSNSAIGMGFQLPADRGWELWGFSPRSFLETSGNVIVEALRRVGNEIELRLVECTGRGGEVMVRTNLPHKNAVMTNLIGKNRLRLKAQRSPRPASSEYRFDVKPQQIVTLRLQALDAVAQAKALTTFDPLIPEKKRESTRGFIHPELKGVPPDTGIPIWTKMEQ